MRVPEGHDKPEDYFMDIYNDFKRDLKKDMEDNNELYGHHKSCTEYGKNYEYIEKFWNRHSPKEGYDGERRVSKMYADFIRDKKIGKDNYLYEPLYYHKKHGWGLALTYDEVMTCIIEPLSNLYKSIEVAPVVRGHEVISDKNMNPKRLKRLGRLEMILRPLLLTQGIFCPCRLEDSIKTNLELGSYGSVLQKLINEKLLFKISGDDFGSLKLINWPYNDPPI
tara:strand:- start:490 stop:1158 length:669 start_codon:yes stop_codon:yes gene_type:complete